MRIEEAREHFLSYLEAERGYSPLTVSAYRSDIGQFISHQEKAGQVEGIETSDLREFMVSLQARGLQASTIARRLCSLRSFWKYLRDTEYTGYDPFLKISTPKKERPLPTYLTAQECTALLEAAERQRSVFLGFRDKAALATLIFTGVRRGELLNLRVASVDFQGESLIIEKGKGKKTRVLPLAQPLREALQDWLELRPQCNHDFLFTVQWGAKLSKRGLTGALRRALKGAGITKPGITLHKLRHSFASLMLQNGCDLYSLSKMLGHTRLDTTAIYLHTTVEHLRAALACHPLVPDKSAQG